jgi:hypothetical protein
MEQIRILFRKTQINQIVSSIVYISSFVFRPVATRINEIDTQLTVHVINEKIHYCESMSIDVLTIPRRKVVMDTDHTFLSIVRYTE